MRGQINLDSDDKGEFQFHSLINNQQEKFKHTFHFCYLDSDKINDFIRDIYKTYSELNLQTYDMMDAYYFIMITDNKNISIVIFWGGEVLVFSDEMHFLQELQPIFMENKLIREENKKPKIQTHYFYLQPGMNPEIKTHSFVEDSEEIKSIIPEMYPGIDAYKLAKQYRNSDESILILMGPPGYGKTTLIKYIMKEHSIKRSIRIDDAYVKDAAILEHDYLWITLSDGSFEYLILDDLDFAMLPRDKNEKNPFVSKLLSYTEGIIKSNTKVIITTNKDMDNIDSALVRPGRCFDVLDLQPMKRSLAKKIWIDYFEFAEVDFSKHFSEKNTISQALFMSKIRDLKKDNEKTYLLDPNLSMRDKYLE